MEGCFGPGIVPKKHRKFRNRKFSKSCGFGEHPIKMELVNACDSRIR
jgi:hypothetical protein